MRPARTPLPAEVLEQLELDGWAPEPCELAHLAAEPIDPIDPDFDDGSSLDLAVDLDGTTPYRC